MVSRQPLSVKNKVAIRAFKKKNATLPPPLASMTPCSPDVLPFSPLVPSWSPLLTPLVLYPLNGDPSPLTACSPWGMPPAPLAPTVSW